MLKTPQTDAMKILYRYILKEHIGPFFLGFSVITFILVMDFIVNILDLIIDKGLGVSIVSEIFLLNLAWIAALSIPMAVLIATLMAFGRLSADNEITAIKASGTSLYRMITPSLATAIGIAILLVWFNDHVLPEANHRARSLMSAIHRKRPVISIKDKEGIFINDFPGYSLLIKKINERTSELKGVTIYDQRNKKFPVTIRANRGIMRFTPDGEKLTLHLFDGEIHELDQADPTRYRRLTFERYSLSLDCEGTRLRRIDSRHRGDREMTIEMMRRKIAGLQRDIDQHQRKIITIAKGHLGKHSPDRAEILENNLQNNPIEGSKLIRSPGFIKDRRTRQQLQSELRLIENKQKQINRYLVEIHKKYSIPAACIIFILIGAPLGIMARQGGWAVGLGISLGFFLLYWAFLIGGEELADRGIVPPFWAMWIPNFLIGGAGAYLIFKTVRETTFIPWDWLKVSRKRLKNWLKPDSRSRRS